MDTEFIRNFCIIAHIDHGKSTLADRLLEVTGTIAKRNLKEQTLDQLELEREKGITIKLKAVRMPYEREGQTYQLNLIDTPGHVDFSYEVSRSLAACEGAVLVVDATQGIQAQTVSNVYKALEANLKIIPVINKIDVKGNHADKVEQDLVATFGFKQEDIIKVSAKTGENIDELLEAIVNRIPPPQGDKDAPFQALVFDVFFDDFLGVVTVVRVVNGTLQETDNRERVYFKAGKADSLIQEIGIFSPQRQRLNKLSAGEVGYIATGLKDIHAVAVGDTACRYRERDLVESLPGYKRIKPFVFVSIFPINNKDYPELRKGLDKLALSDAALVYEAESNNALGFGFRCGFLGLLHADVVQERLEREYGLELISTTPSVEYEIVMRTGKIIHIKRPADMPDPSKFDEIREPWIRADIITPAEYIGGVITLLENRRGIQKNLEYASANRVFLEYELPLQELVRGFFDSLKSVSSGYASMDYELIGFRPVDAVKLDIVVHGEKVEPLAQIVLRQEAEKVGRQLAKHLKEELPRQQFKVAIQAMVGGKVVARENLGAMRKNVLAKMSGGHRERKDKLLEIQKKGKERMKRLGRVEIPQRVLRDTLMLR